VVLFPEPAFDYGQELSIGGILTLAPAPGSTVSVSRTDRTGSYQLGSFPVGEQGLFGFTDTPVTTGPVTYTVRYAGNASQPPGVGKGTTIIRPLEYDVNTDGYADVAVSAPGESVGGAAGGGAVWIFSGSASGLRTDNVRTIDVNATPIPEKTFAYFGETLAAGDFNFDGSDDLAIGASRSGPGYVVVFHGDDMRGLTYREMFSQDTDGVPGANHDGDGFGGSLAVGDVDGYGQDDLVVGAPNDSEDRGWATGSVTVIHGNLYGLIGYGAQRWTKDIPGVPGGSGSFNVANGDAPDGFGRQVVLADRDGDTSDDLAVGAPGSPFYVDGVRKRDAGTVTVLYSDGSRIGNAGAVQVSQQTAGMPGISGQEDLFGTTLAAGDANGDRDAELAIYSPGDTYLTVVPGTSSGLAYGNARAWTQNSSGIPGTTESGDRWGGSSRFGYVKSAVRTSLVVGAPGENSGQGACTVIHGSGTGLTATGAQYLSQDTIGVPGTAESYDSFGTF
jgi:hypothetical protein